MTAAAATAVAFIIITIISGITSSSVPGDSLCFNSPNPSSCKLIVSDAIVSTDLSTSNHLHVVKKIIARSMNLSEVTISTATVDGRSSPAVADCTHLLELSFHRLFDSVTAIDAGEDEDVLTWLSSVLTYHETCLVGLRDGDLTPIKTGVMELKAMASAALAVFNSGKVTWEKDESYVSPSVAVIPPWITDEFPDGEHLHPDTVVDVTGKGSFRTVQDAVNAAPENSKRRYVIHVRKGKYKENVVVTRLKKNIMIVGDGMHRTIIIGHRNVVDGDTTFNSGTLISEGDNFILQDIAVRNIAGAAKHQAVAVRISGDKTVINRCLINAYQDTLYTHTNRQFVRDSIIAGTVDFIFGNAAVVFQNCKLISKLPMPHQKNVVTAQGRTDPNQNTGISIQLCQVIPSKNLAPVSGWIQSYLGRPWKKYSRTVYMESYIGGHIAAKGWLPWDGNFGLNTLFYGEYDNEGAGASTHGRVEWKGFKKMTDSTEATPFTVKSLIQGERWLGSTGVTFRSGL